MRKALLIVGIAFILSSMAFSQPFGIRFGMNLVELRTVAKIDEKIGNEIYLITPAKSSIYFPSYMVQISQNYGVYALTAFGYICKMDESVIVLRNHADGVIKLLTETYGTPNIKLDTLKDNGYKEDETRNWVISLNNNESYFHYIWNKDMPYNIKSISLRIQFLSISSHDCCLLFECIPKNYDEIKKQSEGENPF